MSSSPRANAASVDPDQSAISPTDHERSAATDDRASRDLQPLVQRLLGRIQAATRDLAAMRADEILEASELLAVTALHAHASAQDAQRALDRAARPFEVDALTGLPNRALFRDRCAQALAHARRRHSHVALLFVDLDHFKQINDDYGHAVGDELIRHVARCLKNSGRDVDTVCRHGGDEFLVLLSEIGDASSAARYAEKVIQSLSEPVRIGDRTLIIGASIGISLYPEDGDDQELLIQRADIAMYVAKRTGGAYAYASIAHGRGATATPARVDALHDPVGLLEVALAEAHTAIADLKASNERYVLDALNAEREQHLANQAKDHQSQLLNIVAHELRNSLAPLQSAYDVLTLMHADTSLLPRVELILKRQIGHMTTLLTDLLDVSRLNLGRAVVRLQRTDIRVALDMAVEQMRPGYAKRGREIVRLIETESNFVLGDESRLVQVFATLLERVSLTAVDGALITLALYAHDGELVIALTEGAEGKAAHDANAQLLSIVNDHPVPTSGVDGMGLSLLVVIAFIESHHGRLAVSSSDVNARLRFQITFPLADQSG